MKIHKKTQHLKTFRCKKCDETFHVSKDLEIHIKSHRNCEEFKCDDCEKVFYLKWRLSKHKEIHNKDSLRHCHYYDNGKSCPLEEVGCMFLQKDSAPCKFGIMCKNNLCQYKREVQNNNDDESKLEDEFIKLTEDEQWEVRQLVCDETCNGAERLHACSYDACEISREWNIMQYDYDYDDNDEKLESFPCEECGEVLTTLDDFGKHLTDTHDGKVKPKQCVVSDCYVKIDSMETLIHHIGVKHYLVVKQS